jgi:predicted nucleic acid-binding protein
MAKYFLESSAWVKRYKPETGTDFVNSVFSPSNDLFYLNLAIIEVRKVFYRQWKHPQAGETPISEDQFKILEGQFAKDLQEMIQIEFSEEMIIKAMEVIETVWLPSAFDLTHLSAYLITKEEYPDLIFVCSDHRSKLIDAAKEFVSDDDVLKPEEQP